MALVYVTGKQQIASGPLDDALLRSILDFVKNKQSSPQYHYSVSQSQFSFDWQVSETAVLCWSVDAILCFVAPIQYPSIVYSHLVNVFQCFKLCFNQQVLSAQDLLFQQSCEYLTAVSSASVDLNLALPNSFELYRTVTDFTSYLSSELCDSFFAAVLESNVFIHRINSNPLLTFLSRLLQFSPKSVQYVRKIYINDIEYVLEFSQFDSGSVTRVFKHGSNLKLNENQIPKLLHQQTGKLHFQGLKLHNQQQLELKIKSHCVLNNEVKQLIHTKIKSEEILEILKQNEETGEIL
ncbi:Hypothetical_protein [Hexamita inflata]|uniref:Hypothetical_protein n=1 Tax=Hexamita inflata TaxID=28002 RepID=A0AA86U9K0_9EUKA|nr:Hypothetical protein HINF_LOCUS36480 [Hexamita inflata]